VLNYRRGKLAGPSNRAITIWFDELGNFSVVSYLVLHNARNVVPEAAEKSLRPLCDAIANALESGALPMPLSPWRRQGLYLSET
jgi:hypothetical protein